MARRLTFQYIADSRFNQDKSYLLKLDEQLKQVLSKYDCLTIEEGQIKEVHFKDNIEGDSKQYRKRYWITKKGRKLTWNDVYKLINSVKAECYEFV